MEQNSETSADALLLEEVSLYHVKIGKYGCIK